MLIIGKEYNINNMTLIYCGKEKENCNCSECGKKIKSPLIFESDEFGTIAIGSECIKKYILK